MSDISKVVSSIMVKQSELNKVFCGENYLDTGKAEKTGKPIVFGLALLSELTEFLDSRNWKHWKSGNEIDKRNSITELIDKIHFFSAASIQLYYRWYTSDKGIPKDKVLFPGNLYTGFAERVNDLYNNLKKISEHKDVLKVPSEKDEENDFLKMIVSSTRAVSAIVSSGMELDKKDINFHIDSIARADIEIVNSYARTIYYLDRYLGVTPDNLLAMYMVKNVLNSFRIENGYDKGEYLKMWGGVEDNDYIYELVKNSDMLGKDVDVLEKELYELISKEYNKFI